VTRVLLLSLVTLLGLLAASVSGYYLLRDWSALNQSYARFEQLALRGSDLRAVFIAEAQQNVFRINCFAEGVGVLLGGILAAIGLHGLCLLPRSRSTARGTDV
jgi:hypothetical protein